MPYAKVLDPQVFGRHLFQWMTEKKTVSISSMERDNNDKLELDEDSLLAFADHVRAQRGEPDERKARDMIAEGYQWHPIYRCWNKPAEDFDREKREFIRRCVMEVFGTMSMEDEVSHGFMEQTITNAKRFWAQLRERGL